MENLLKRGYCFVGEDKKEKKCSPLFNFIVFKRLLMSYHKSWFSSHYQE